MGTVSEDWHAKKEKQDAMVAEFLSGIDSEDVLRARLYGLGLRGDYLSSEVKQAAARKHALGRNVHMDKGRVYLPNPTKNWNCDNDKCREKHGEVRLRSIRLQTGGEIMVKTENKVTTVEAFFNYRSETPGALRYQETDENGNIKKGDNGGAVIDALYLRKSAMSGKVMRRFKVTITELPE